jgi:hypothetical protein
VSLTEELSPSLVQREKKHLSPKDRVQIVSLILDLLEQYASSLRQAPSFPEIFAPCASILEDLAGSQPHPALRPKIGSVLNTIRARSAACSKPSSVLDAEKPKMLRMYEPRVDEE